MGDLPVYDVVLLPPQEAGIRSVQLSQQCAERAATEFTLGEDGPYAHLSLYMANFTPAQREAAASLLRSISAQTPRISLDGDHFAGNEQGMFELFYRTSQALTRLQEEVIAALAPLRTGLRHRDPVGRVLSEYRLTAPPLARDNLERYGYDEVGELFRPHITMTRFQQRAHQVDPAALPPAQAFTATYRTLALCVMGEHGTCTDIVETFDLAADAPSPSPALP
ncbi:DUF1045 domain-containing protein [Nonomuraea sp. NPDC049152]|uniref:DUF1045 domain-containing protein n=1 Tax=Nonomuraea sp. NPDC049152 TaxID=3154350 RepID=UPI0033C681EE